MKFVHIADMHLDMPFRSLSNIRGESFGEKRRLEQRQIMKEIVQYIKENNIPYFFIAGDLYEHELIRESTIRYVNELFNQIPQTSIFIAPGNHDPYLKNSFYNQYKWGNNVHIFGHKLEKIETEDANIYGFGFNDFYCNDFSLEGIELNKDKLNILVIHGSIDGSTAEEMQYNSMSKNKLKEFGFDYVALGHIHKLDYQTEENQRMVYPGSTISSGFDELGKHGMIVGNLTKNSISLDFIPLDKKEMIEEKINISDIYLEEELIEKIEELEIEENKYIKIILIGNKNFEINILHLNKLIENKNIIKIKDNSKIKCNIEKLLEENNLKGLFIKECILEKEKGEVPEELINKIIEVGLNNI